MRRFESNDANDGGLSASTRDSVNKNNFQSIAIRYVLSSAAATVAETTTYPLDILKTRLQIQNELKKAHKTTDSSKLSHGMFGMAINMAKHEGIKSLWAGVTPAVYRHLIYTGGRLVFYEKLREYFKKEDGKFPLWKAIIVGCSSGAFAQFLASPTDLVKVIMQVEGKRRLEGHEPRIKNVHDAFVQIYKESGVRGLWRGSVVNVQRAALVSLGDLATYDFVKRFVMENFGLKDDYKTHTLSSLVSGLIAATMGTPADVVKTRIMCQPVDSNGRGSIYRSSWHCLVLTFKHEGLHGLYKGYWPTWLRMAPWSLTFWLSYEEIRKLCGLSGF